MPRRFNTRIQPLSGLTLLKREVTEIQKGYLLRLLANKNRPMNSASIVGRDVMYDRGAKSLLTLRRRNLITRQIVRGNYGGHDRYAYQLTTEGMAFVIELQLTASAGSSERHPRRTCCPARRTGTRRAAG